MKKKLELDKNLELSNIVKPIQPKSKVKREKRYSLTQLLSIVQEFGHGKTISEVALQHGIKSEDEHKKLELIINTIHNYKPISPKSNYNLDTDLALFWKFYYTYNRGNLTREQIFKKLNITVTQYSRLRVLLDQFGLIESKRAISEIDLALRLMSTNGLSVKDTSVITKINPDELDLYLYRTNSHGSYKSLTKVEDLEPEEVSSIYNDYVSGISIEGLEDKYGYHKSALGVRLILGYHQTKKLAGFNEV